MSVRNADSDYDGVRDGPDNCRSKENRNQADLDRDGRGDTCDADPDGDGLTGGADNCPRVRSVDQRDADRDRRGDVCDADDDNDGLSDRAEGKLHTRPFDKDSDDDGLSDGAEVKAGTNPRRQDTDRDGLADGLERGKRRPITDPRGPVTATKRSRFHPRPRSRLQDEPAPAKHRWRLPGRRPRGPQSQRPARSRRD